MATISSTQESAVVGRPSPNLRAIFDAQRSASRAGTLPYARRVASLGAIESVVLDRQAEIVRAVDEDFGGRAREETLGLELAPLIDSLRHTKRHLRQWMKTRSVRAGIQYFPASAKIVYQPLGVVGIAGAWNYPILLTLLPLVDAIGAGNRVMLKPSELAPATAELLRSMLAGVFSEDYVAVVNGDAAIGAEFATLPFDHLLFTGSTRVGKMIMSAASKNLTPVTLELGGKSPAIVHQDFPLRTAVERILTGKLYNAGQTCLAPDYVLVHESKRDEFVALAQEIAARLYPEWLGNPQYTRIINRAHYQRLQGYLDDAAARSARVISLGKDRKGCDSTNRVFPGVLIADVNDSMQVMQEEIFGPILPVLTYRDLGEALKYVNDHPRPLALYYFDYDAARVERVLDETTSGGVTINDVIYHIAQNNLPFGGIGPSGMGHYHGRAGFETFSQTPPYGPVSERVIRFLLRK